MKHTRHEIVTTVKLVPPPAFLTGTFTLKIQQERQTDIHATRVIESADKIPLGLQLAQGRGEWVMARGGEG